jgi:hypothetical protein
MGVKRKCTESDSEDTVRGKSKEAEEHRSKREKR